MSSIEVPLFRLLFARQSRLALSSPPNLRKPEVYLLHRPIHRENSGNPEDITSIINALISCWPYHLIVQVWGEVDAIRL